MESKSLIKQAYNHESLNKIIFDLTFNILSNTFNSIKKREIEEDLLRKVIWLVSILSTSSDNIHRSKAQLFTSLLYLNNTENIEILKVCYILYSRIGNLTATKFLSKLYENEEENPVDLKSKYHFGDLITEELIDDRELGTIISYKKNFLSTNFQKQLWNSLKKNDQIAISAPTSSGKSFIIKQFLIDKFHEDKIFRALYIVPSRALINQVSEDFISEINFDVHVKSSFLEDNDIFEKEIYVLTPERCIKLLTSNITLDFIFVDEIQGVEDLSGRGHTFEYVFNEIAKKFPNAKIVTAGPNILNPEKTFSEIFEKESFSVLTKLSPVFQMKITLKYIRGGLFSFRVQNEAKKSQEFKHDFNYDFSSINTLGGKMAFLINKIAPNDFNIVYVSDGDLAQKWAIKYANLKESQLSIQDEVKELIDFLKEDIHKMYFLIECLQKGVAYHHGSLPDIVRKEIENLYINEQIKTLFCTSTLLEGVNLPANNLFTLQPKKNNTPLTKFEFGNLIGRAGRLNSSLYGTVYYLERYDDKIKASEYLDVEYDKEIRTFSSSAILSFEKNDLKLKLHEIEKEDKTKTSSVQQFCVFLRQKYSQDNHLVKRYLRKKDYSENDINKIMFILAETMSNLKIPHNVLAKNPTIDPLLQNELYNLIVDSDITDWVINRNSNYNEFWNYQDVSKLPNNLRPFYWQLVNIFERLDKVFNITNEALVKHNKWVNPKSMSLQAKKWLASFPLGQIIKDDITYKCSERVNPVYRKDAENVEDVNSIINETIRYNSSITTHLLPKYTKVLADVLEEVLTEEQKELYKVTLSLPTCLELGTQEQNVIQLISSGITRSVAIQISNLYKKNTTKDYREANNVWEWLSSKTELPELKPIYNRYLKRLNIFKIL